MSDYRRRIVVDSNFETAVSEVSCALRDEGLQVIARVDVRDHFWRHMGHDFRQYVLIEAWSPEIAYEALIHNLAIGAALPTTFAVYELADGETAVVARDPMPPMAGDPVWHDESPALAAIVDRERKRIGRVLSRVEHRKGRESRISSAA
jgi:uncharacterized protein (DUF302 family)